MNLLRRNLTYANVMATLAFMLALTGGAYAVSVPKNSVGTKQLRKNAVTNAKIKKGSLTIDRFSKKSQQSLKVAGAKGDAGAPGAPGAPGLVRAYGYINVGVLDTSRDHKGIASVRTTPTYTCVKLDPSINASKSSPIVTNEFGSGFDFSSTTAVGLSQPAFNVGCNQGNEIGVGSGTWRTNSATYGLGPGKFFIAVP